MQADPTTLSGRLLRLGEVSDDDTQPLHRGSGGSTYTRKARATREAPSVVRSEMTGPTGRKSCQDGAEWIRTDGHREPGAVRADFLVGAEGIQTAMLLAMCSSNLETPVEQERASYGQLYRFQPHAQIKLEPWLVQRAIDRLGDRRLDATEQATVVDATRTPGKVGWPDWWET